MTTKTYLVEYTDSHGRQYDAHHVSMATARAMYQGIIGVETQDGAVVETAELFEAETLNGRILNKYYRS